MKRKITLNKEEEKVMKDFMKGSISSRDAGKVLKISHQQVINLCSSLTIQWIEEGKLKLNNK